MKRTPEQIYDEWLVLRIQSGDAEGFEELVKRWHKRLWRHVMRLTNGNEEAADVVQEIWITVVKKLNKLDDPACFPHWIYRIATSRTVDWIRKQQRRRRLLKDFTENEVQDDILQPEKGEQQSDIDKLRQAVSRLPLKQRTILNMFYLEELSIIEISVALALPAGTVKSRLHHSRNQLRKLIERSDKDERD